MRFIHPCIALFLAPAENLPVPSDNVFPSSQSSVNSVGDNEDRAIVLAGLIQVESCMSTYRLAFRGTGETSQKQETPKIGREA
jgi:hypothetical protein